MKGVILLLTLMISETAEAQRYSIDGLSWMAGCWVGGGEKRVSEEQWMKPGGKSMLGMSRSVSNGKTVEYEFLRLHEEENGDIFYTANPSGQEQASFKLVKLEGTKAVFENPEHDFPQRIIYMLEDDGSLKARIEGKSKGKERGVDFPMKKTKCD
ncbi:MAG: hypothetical protein HW412_1821 [Bacteroidetes bacterium]|nr:hypothetical protein [Bacteroidota bacterium]